MQVNATRGPWGKLSSWLLQSHPSARSSQLLRMGRARLHRRRSAWRLALGRGGSVRIALALQASASLQAQSPTFRSGTRVVSLFATVTDAQKRLVPDLTQDEFEVYDNEKLQPIVLFENRIQPISVVVMLDTSLSMTGSIKLLQEAAEQFVMRLLPDDKAKVGAFNDKIEVSAQIHEQPGRTDLRHQESRLRQRHATVGWLDDGTRRAEGSGRPPRGAGVHRRRRHLEPRQFRRCRRPRPRRRSDDLRDRTREPISSTGSAWSEPVRTAA